MSIRHHSGKFGALLLGLVVAIAACGGSTFMSAAQKRYVAAVISSATGGGGPVIGMSNGELLKLGKEACSTQPPGDAQASDSPASTQQDIANAYANDKPLAKELAGTATQDIFVAQVILLAYNDLCPPSGG